MRSPRLHRAAVASLTLGALAVALSCDDPSRSLQPRIPHRGAQFVISDAANGGTPGFYFLPPMVPDAGPFSGTFDATVTPVVKICRFDGTTCTGGDIVINTEAGANGISVNLAGQSYNAIWQAPSNLGVGNTYRLRVYRNADGTDLVGYADLIIVAKSKDTKTVPFGYIGVVRGSPFQIKFRFETAGAGDVAPFLDTHTPDNNAANVATTANVVVNFSEAVNVTGDWFKLSCSVSGDRGPADATVTGGPTSFTIDPTVDFTAGESCTATIFAAQIADQDAIDPPDNMATDATWTFTIAAGSGNIAPTAQNDAFNATVGVTLNGNLFSDNGSGTDALGTPAATVTSFGGGTLGGTVTDHAAGTSTALAGGTLTVNADGTFSLASSTATGPVTFQYRLTNSQGTSDATVTITVNAAPAIPVPVNDGPSAGSVPGSAYHVAFNSTYTLVATGLLSNDALGTPAGTVSSYGGGSLGGTITDHAAATTTTFGTGGSLTVNADGSISFTPSTGFTGLFTFQYRVTNSGGSGDATVTIAVGARPAATNDTYATTLVGNVPINTATSSNFSVLSNDAGDALQPALVSATNGTATVSANGTFTFSPNAGYEGPASITYKVSNGFGDAPANATISLTVGEPVWFVDAAVGSNGDGRFGTPFNCLTGAGCASAAARDANDRIFLASGSYTGGITLQSGERVIGKGATGTFGAAVNANLTWPADAGPEPTLGGAAPTITSGTDDIVLGANNTLKGFNLGNATGSAISGAAFGTLTISEVGINSTGRALGLSTGTVAGSLIGITSTGGVNNVLLNAVATSGTFALGSGALSGATSDAFRIQGASSGTYTFGGTIAGGTGSAVLIAGGSANVALSGNVSQANAFPLVSVSLTHTGTLTMSGQVSASNGSGLQFSDADGTYNLDAATAGSTLSGGDAGVDILAGSGGTFTFGSNLSIVNPTGTAFYVNASAPTVTMKGPITQGAAKRGVFLENNTGGSSTFTGVLTLATTTVNAFEATNTSLAGSVTVQTATTNTLSTSTGVALRVNNVNIGANGITFQTIGAVGGANGIVLNNTGTSGGLTVTGTGTAGSGGSIQNAQGADGADAGNGILLKTTRKVSLSFMNLSGHQNNGVSGTAVRGLTMNHMRFTGTNGTSNSGAFSESPVRLLDIGGPVKLSNSRFDGGAYNAVRIDNTAGTAPTLDSLVIESDTVETMQGSTADVRGTALLVTLTDGTADVRIRNNRVTVWWGNAIHVLAQGTSSATTRITNNFVDNTNGALAGAGGIWVAGGQHTYKISGNTVRHTNGTAISADRTAVGALMNGTIDANLIGVSGDANSGSFTGTGIFASQHGTGTTTVRISNNVLRQINGSANGAIWALSGDASGFGGSGTINATIVGNNIQESGTTVNSAQHGILVTHGTQSGPPNDTDQGCYDVGGAGALANTIANFNTASGATAQNRIRVNQRFGTTSRWPGYTGAALGATSTTDLAAYLLGRNIASNSTNANSSTGGFLNTNPAGSACPQPTLLP